MLLQHQHNVVATLSQRNIKTMGYKEKIPTKSVKMLCKLGLKVTGFWLLFGCHLVVSWSQYVVTTYLGIYICTLSQSKFTILFYYFVTTAKVSQYLI